MSMAFKLDHLQPVYLIYHIYLFTLKTLVMFSPDIHSCLTVYLVYQTKYYVPPDNHSFLPVYPIYLTLTTKPIAMFQLISILV